MLIIRQEAAQEIKTAGQWYQPVGMAEKFIAAIETTLVKIENTPDLYPIVYKNIRRAFCQRFPYAVYFVKTEDVVVIAVLHQRQNSSVISTRN